MRRESDRGRAIAGHTTLPSVSTQRMTRLETTGLRTMLTNAQDSAPRKGRLGLRALRSVSAGSSVCHAAQRTPFRPGFRCAV